jgi:hypothetical protein
MALSPHANVSGLRSPPVNHTIRLRTAESVSAMTIKARSIALKGLQSTERLDVSLRNADSARPPYRGSARTDTLGIRDRPAWMQQQPIEPEFIESGTYGDHDYLALRHLWVPKILITSFPEILITYR